MGCILVILISMVFVIGGWVIVNGDMIILMMFFGLIGIFIGDIVLFVCLNCMGFR